MRYRWKIEYNISTITKFSWWISMKKHWWQSWTVVTIAPTRSEAEAFVKKASEQLKTSPAYFDEQGNEIPVTFWDESKGVWRLRPHL